MREAVIVSTARTPIGRAYRGSLNRTRSPTMMGHAIRHAVERANVEGGEVEDVVIGTVLSAGTLLRWSRIAVTFHTTVAIIEFWGENTIYNTTEQSGRQAGSSGTRIRSRAPKIESCLDFDPLAMTGGGRRRDGDLDGEFRKSRASSTPSRERSSSARSGWPSRRPEGTRGRSDLAPPKTEVRLDFELFEMGGGGRAPAVDLGHQFRNCRTPRDPQSPAAL